MSSTASSVDSVLNGEEFMEVYQCLCSNSEYNFTCSLWNELNSISMFTYSREIELTLATLMTFHRPSYLLE